MTAAHRHCHGAKILHYADFPNFWISEDVTVLQTICEGYPQESRADLVKNSAIATMAVSIPIVVVRFAARYFKGFTIGLDDWTCLAALVSRRTAGLGGRIDLMIST